MGTYFENALYLGPYPYLLHKKHTQIVFFFFWKWFESPPTLAPYEREREREREREYGYVGTLFIKVYIVRLEHSSEALFFNWKKQTPFSVVVLGEKNFGFIFFPSRSLSFRQLSHSAISHNATLSLKLVIVYDTKCSQENRVAHLWTSTRNP